MDQPLGWVPDPGREITGMTILRGRTLRRPWGRRPGPADSLAVPAHGSDDQADAEPPGLDPDDEAYLDYVAPPRMPVTTGAEPFELGDDGPVAGEAKSSWRSLSRTPGPGTRDHDTEVPAGPPTSFAPVGAGQAYGPPVVVTPVVTTPFVSPTEMSRPGSESTSGAFALPAPERGIAEAAATTALQDEVTLATATLQTLIQTHRSELAGLISEVALLRTTVTDMRREFEGLRQRGAPVVEPLGEPTSAPVAAPVVEPVAEERPALTPPSITKPVLAKRRTAGPHVPAAATGSAPPAPPSALAARIARLEIQAAAAVSAAGARIGLPAGHVDVLQRWVANDGKGVIEVAHPGGRHRVGLAAVVYAVSSGRQVLVVVPNLDSAASWQASLNAHASEMQVLVDEGRRRDESGPTPNVVISTAATTARRITAGFEPTAMLVAVDAERFSTALLAKALDDRCEWRLGLSEAYRSNTRGLARYADAYFGGTVLTIA